MERSTQSSIFKSRIWIILVISQYKYILIISRSSRPDMFCKTGVLRNFIKFTVKLLCQSLFNKSAGLGLQLIKKETLAQVFPCEFCEISKNIFFTEHLRATASAFLKKVKVLNLICLFLIISKTSERFKINLPVSFGNYRGPLVTF